MTNRFLLLVLILQKKKIPIMEKRMAYSKQCKEHLTNYGNNLVKTWFIIGMGMEKSIRILDN